MDGIWSVRRAGTEAVERATPLLERFFTEEGFATAPDLIHSRLSALLNDEAGAVFLAWDGAAAVGVATVSTSFGIEYGRSAELDDLYVLPEARGQGVAQALINAVRAWCQEHRCTVLLVTVTTEGEAAHGLVAFYRGRGFEDTGRRLLSLALTS